MEMIQIIELLVREADSNPASNAVFHVWALRKRARNNVALTSLYNKMKKEGFNHSASEYIPVLKLLSSLGLGELVVNAKDKVKGLKNVRVTLQSIGAAACKQKSYIENFKPRNKFSPLTSRDVKLKETAPQPVAMSPKRSKNNFVNINFTIDINGKEVMIPIPKGLSGDDIASLINKFHAV